MVCVWVMARPAPGPQVTRAAVVFVYVNAVVFIFFTVVKLFFSNEGVCYFSRKEYFTVLITVYLLNLYTKPHHYFFASQIKKNGGNIIQPEWWFPSRVACKRDRNLFAEHFCS
jgi:hypothetical protein